MKNLKQIKRKNANEHKKVSVQESTKILAEFFNGIVINFEE